MKKNIAAIIILCVFSLAFLISCGGETAETGANNEGSRESVQPSGSESEESANNNDDIFGVITQIAGNFVVIDYAVMPETGFPVPRSMGAMMNNMREIDPANLPEGVEINEDGGISFPGGAITRSEGGFSFSGELPEGFDAEAIQSFRTEGGMGGQGRATRGEMPEGFEFDGEMIERRLAEGGMGGVRTGGGMMGSAVLEYTGENTEFILPIGVPIYNVTSDEEDGEVETEIDLNEIQSGNVISVAYKSDGKTIDKIRISQVRVISQSDIEEMLPEGMTFPGGNNTTESE